MDLKVRIKNRLEELRKENLSIERERATLDERQREIEGKIEELSAILKEDEGESPRRFKIKLKKPAPVKRMPDSILSILAGSPEKYFSAVEVSSELERRGLKSDAQDFTQSVRTTLNGLRRDGKVDFQVEKGGKKLYRAKK